MTENPPPIRPQRGMVRTNRETTGGLLMSVIRSMQASSNLEDRNRERAELEKGFAQCDQKLDDLVAQHSNDLYHVMNTFSKILNNLGRSKERLLDTREKLQNCQKLLHCKRDELKKLWLESVENRTVLDLLERIEAVAALPRQVDSYTSKKYFLHAAQCCVDGLRQLGEDPPAAAASSNLYSASAGSRHTKMSTSRGNYGESGYGVLSKIDALAEVRTELMAKKEALFEVALDELHRHLYLISSAEVRKRFHRTGSFRSGGGHGGDLELSGGRKMMSTMSILHSNAAEIRKLLRPPSVDQSAKDLEASLLFQPDASTDPAAFDDYPEEDSRQFISMLTKCLGLLNKIPDAIEVIRERCDREFINVVIKTAQDVLFSSGGGASSTAGSSSASATRSNSFLDISSISSDSMAAAANSTFESSGSINGAQTTATGSQVVLTCTALLGHSYNGYSHLTAAGGGHHLGGGALQLNKCSLQLQDFFDMLMRQYRAIVSLHESIVLPNLQKIESGLHAFAESDGSDGDSTHSSTHFYTAHDLWSKVQSLVQQLLEYYLDTSHLPTAGLSAPLNTNSLHFLLSHAASSPSSAAAAAASASAAALPVDYSSYFSKRRALAGAMNAVNAMTKNTMTAVVSSAQAAAASAGSAAASASAAASDQNSGSPASSDRTSGTLGAGSTPGHSSSTPHHGHHHGHSTSTPTQSATSNFLSSFSGGGGSSRSPTVQLFKFDHSSQAIAWNGFLAEQQQQQQNQLLSPKSDGEKKSDDSKDEDASPASATTSASITSPSVIIKLFETLRTIATPSPDNLVVIYGTLMKFAQQSPPFTDPELDLDARSIKSLSSVSGNVHSESTTTTLQAYLIAAAEKFAAHINEQLEKMLEIATKSLEAGTTISIAHMSPLTAAITLEECETTNSTSDYGTVSKAQQNQHHFAQQQLNSKLYPPLLESAVLVDIATRDLRTLMQAMPDYSNIFLGYICNYLSAFKDACTDAYNGIVESTGQAGGPFANSVSSMDIHSAASGHGGHHGHVHPRGGRIISANWAKDEDITRLLKFLPNWKTLDEHQKEAADLSGYLNSSSPALIPSIKPTIASRPTGRRRFNHQMSSFDESPEEIRLRNMKETEVLIQTLSQEVHDSDLLPASKGQFRQLAQLQESFEWIAARCTDLVGSIEAMQQQADHPGIEQFRQLPDVYIATLNGLAKDFADLAETVLLVMHLEVRVHCFYNLQQLDGQFFTSPPPILDAESSTSRSGQEHYSDDPKIYPLLDDLKRMYDELQRAGLKSYKMVYIFEGLDHLIGTIFINAITTGAIKRIKQTGVKRSCRAIYDIQRRLSTITKSRELALDYARQYFELFLISPEEILAGIIERGPVFQTIEYEHVIMLLHQSGLVQGTSSSSNDSQHAINVDMEANLNRLRDILNNVAVQI